MGKEKDGLYLPLFETKAVKGRVLHKLYAVSVFVGICLICVYRATHVPPQGEINGRWAWIGLFMAELWFSFYWILTQFSRWNPVYRYTFKDRLSQRYGEGLPGVDIFVCTADPRIEPPIMVVNTVLSVMAYDYPPEKLSIYLSDDGGSDLTFYALLEASHFSKYWLPFCNNYKVEPRSPAAYFSTVVHESLDDALMANEWSSIKKLYEDMKDRIEEATRVGRISEEIREKHKRFREWEFVSSRHDHQPIIQILIDGRDLKAGGIEFEGEPALPTVVYVAREKRPQYHHNFKAGAMNTLIRVSSKISNGSIILNVDCDMYSNNSESVRDALCFFMDEEKGQEIAYVQHPQNYDNLTKNDIYGSNFRVINELELAGMDANGGPCYVGSGCFHRRDTLCGMKYSKECQGEYWKTKNDTKETESATLLEEACKVLASCTHEDNTEWGKEMGLKYGFPVEDIVTGLSIQCRGWKSMYFNPERKGFVGVAPTTLQQALVQHKRWSEGQFQIGLSKYCPFVYGHKKIPLQLQFSYSPYVFWAPNSLPTLYYVVVPSLYLLKGISLFPKISSFWVLPFAYVIIAKYGYSLGEFLCCGGTLQGWWNEQRIWMFRRTSSYFFAFLETILRQLGFGKSGFVVTAKVAEEDVSQRYWREVIEFGTTSLMFTILATLAMLNLFSFLWGLKNVIMNLQIRDLEPFALQNVLCGLVVFINLPVYEGLFLRKDKGSMPVSVTYKSVMLALLACSMALY
uniref:Putative cellulose synthase-like protein E6 n=1 Tax=Davidia involucrata TaxID=16924 RepID=A0A5B7BN89_DAVIN